MSGTITIANVLRAGKAGTLNDLFAAHGIGAAPVPSVALTPSVPAVMTLPAPDMLNANRNVIPGVETSAAPATVLAPMPAAIAAQDKAAAVKSFLKKWWPWILVALLGAAIVLKSGGRKKSGE